MAEIDIEQYDVSYQTGTMLPKPLKELPSYFEPWNRIAKSIPELYSSRRVREEVDMMPLLDHTKLNGHNELRLAHLQLCFITAGYVWQDGDAGVIKVLPKCLAVPFYRVSEQLGIQPILGHVDLCLANWVLVDPNGPIEAENLECLYHLPGGKEGEWFAIVTFMVEFRFATCLKPMMRALTLAKSKDVNSKVETEITLCLEEITNGLALMKSELSRMHENLKGSTFFNIIRPFLGGWGGSGNALPGGLIYEGISDVPLQLPGGSAAQSFSLQAIDALLGVKHTEDKRAFLKQMRTFMPPSHAKLIFDLEEYPHQVKDIVDRSSSKMLVNAYNQCLNALVEFRSYHMQIVSKYILSASKKTNEGKYLALDKKGTGGTDLIPFLRTLRSDTERNILQDKLEASKSCKNSNKFYVYTLFAGVSLTLAAFTKLVKQI